MTAAGARDGLRLWLVRHGETAGQSSIRYHGRNDVPLSALGRQQVLALAPLLRGIEPRAVVHSPLSRAAESASLLASACGFPGPRLVADARLTEISFGHCEGMTAEEIAAAYPEFWRQHEQGLADAFPGGESRTAFAARVRAAIADHVAAAAEDDLLVVAHRGTVRHALESLLGAGGPLPRGHGVRLGSLSVVHRQEVWRLELLDFVPDEG